MSGFPEEPSMIDLLAHITANEVPSFWLALAVGFVGGVAVTLAVTLRKAK